MGGLHAWQRGGGGVCLLAAAGPLLVRAFPCRRRRRCSHLYSWRLSLTARRQAVASVAPLGLQKQSSGPRRRHASLPASPKWRARYRSRPAARGNSKPQSDRYKMEDDRYAAGLAREVVSALKLTVYKLLRDWIVRKARASNTLFGCFEPSVTGRAVHGRRSTNSFSAPARKPA